MSSLSHNSYLRGSTLGGHSLGFDRFGELGWLNATTDEDGSIVIGSCDLRLLWGEGVWNSILEELFGVELGSGALSGAAGCCLGWLVVFVIVEAVELDILGPDTWADRNGTVGSNGSIGEYCVAASTPTYCFGLESDGDRRGVEGEVRDRECLDWRRGKGTVILGDCWGEREVA